MNTEFLEALKVLRNSIDGLIASMTSEPDKQAHRPANQDTAAAVATPAPAPEPKPTEVKRGLMEVRALFCKICDQDPASTSWCRNVVEQFGCSKLSELTPEQMDKAYAEAAAWLNIPF